MTTTNTSLAVQTAALRKRFGNREAVAGLDLQVPTGCVFGLLGPNGAGKTTVIRAVLGLTKPDAGTVHVLGWPIPARRKEALAQVGAIVEEPRFHWHLTGRENMQVAAAVRDGRAARRAPAALERVGLADRADDRVGGYSLGMRQRLGVARCLLTDPKLLILDEPMNGLDPAGMIQMRELIRSLADEGRTVVVSSHLLDEVEKTCDRVAIIDRGRLVAAGPVTELAGGGGQVMIGCDDPARAEAVLRGLHEVALVARDANGPLTVTPTRGATAAQINRSLVEAGIAVHRLEPVQATLEQRFLEITAHLEAAK